MKITRALFIASALFLAMPSVSFAATQTFTSNGSFSVPAGVTTVTVSMSGGGGSCGSAGGRAGGASKFGNLLVANGGGYSLGTTGGAAGGPGGTAGGSGGMGTGPGAGGNSLFGAGGGAGVCATSVSGNTTYCSTYAYGSPGVGYGGGGGGIAGIYNSGLGGGGGAGAIKEKQLTVTPGVSYPVIVGAEGSAAGYCAGAPGFVQVDYTLPTTGTINTSSNIPPFFFITGPSTLSSPNDGSVRSSWSSQLTGSWTIIWRDLPGYVTPTPATQTLTLVPGGSITFSGTYTAAPTPTPPAIPTPSAPTATLTISPNSVAYGARSTITWSSTNATSCTAGGAWSNQGTLSGSGLTDPLTAPATYTFQCTGPGGTSPLQSVTVGLVANAGCRAQNPTCLPDLAAQLNIVGSQSFTDLLINSQAPSPLVGAYGLAAQPVVQNQSVTFSGTVSNTGWQYWPGPTALDSYNQEIPLGTAYNFPNLFEVFTYPNGPIIAMVNSGTVASLAAGSAVAVSASYVFPSTGYYSVRLCSNLDSSAVASDGGVASNYTGHTTEFTVANNCGSFTIVNVTVGVNAPVVCATGLAYDASTHSCIACSNGGCTGAGGTPTIPVGGLTCNNGTTNPPTCTQASPAPAAVPATPTQPAAPAPATPTPPAAPAVFPCSIWGTTVFDGDSVTAYQFIAVKSPKTCASISELRKCTGGTLSGSFVNQNCKVMPTYNAF